MCFKRENMIKREREKNCCKNIVGELKVIVIIVTLTGISQFFIFLHLTILFCIKIYVTVIVYYIFKNLHQVLLRLLDIDIRQKLDVYPSKFDVFGSSLQFISFPAPILKRAKFESRLSSRQFLPKYISLK